jgi:hypothetical protein
MDSSKLDTAIQTALALHAAASAITALTPTPKDDSAVRRVYRVIELLAMVTKRTKQR